MRSTQRQFILWGSLLALCAAMVVVWGYTFGHENSIQLIPFALHAHDPSLYDQDFFVSHAAARFPNERSFFMLLLMPFGNNLEWPSFIIYVVCSLLLFRALYGIAIHLLEDPWYAFGALMLLIFPLNFHTLGLNELFGRELSTSLLSDTACAWAIWHFLQHKKWSPWLLLIFATLMHPLSGLQVFLLISATLFTQSVLSRRVSQFLRMYGLQIALYMFTGGAFIIALQLGLDDTQWDDATFFQTFFVFRNAHHYIPTAFPHKDWVLLGPLYLITPFLLYRQSKALFIFSLWIIGGCIAYSFCVLQLHSVTVATAQWFKSTMWLEWFMIIAIMLTGKTLITNIKGRSYGPAIYALTVLVSVAWLLIVFPQYRFWKINTAYELPFYEVTTPEIDISRQVKERTAKSDFLIQPAGMDELKYYSERSSFVDYKALTHTKGFIKEWSRRFELVYDIDPATSKVISFDAVRLADEHFRALTPEKLRELHQTYAISHIVTFADVQLPFALLYKNEKYALYQLY
ncbi:MAG TPA: hypothetical protein PLM90_03615 [Chitinophagales bacterium]|nr:hypothetical protein [Chitinophagales bacterium]